MNKIYSSLAVILTCISGASVAQTTITSAAMPQVGFVYNMIADTDNVNGDLAAFVVTPGSSTAQNWNYSTNFNNVYGESTSFLAASAGAGSANFPGATMAVAQSNGTDWIYFTGTTGGLYIDGAHIVQQGTPVDIDITPNSLFMATPCTYGYTNNALSTATFTTVAMGYTVQVRHFADRTVTADAFGSLTTPVATYPNTLRVKTFESTVDSIFLDILGSWNFFTFQTDTTITYNWLQNSQDAQLMQIEMNKTGTAVTKASHLQSFSNGVATVTQAGSAFNLYPNPAAHITYLTYENKTSGNVSLQMFDMSGRMVGQLLNEGQGVGKQKILINVESMHLPKGLYFLQLNYDNKLQTIKLSVN